MTKLIGSVTVTPPQAAPGQSVRVQVLDPSGTPYTAASDVTIALDGIPTAARYYQFPTAGTRTISVYAAGNGTTETATATVTIIGVPLQYHRTLFAPGAPPAPGQLPFIVVAQDLGTPYRATFSLATPPGARAAAALTVAAAAKANAGKPVAALPAQQAPQGFVALNALFATPAALPAALHSVPPSALRSALPSASTANAGGLHLALRTPLPLPAPATSYVWTFGDGQTATTASPTVVHDYFPAIAPGRVPFAFDVSCRVVHDDITVTRTLVLYSAYGMCQQNGTTVPHVEGDVYATLNSDRTSFAASLMIYNIEAAAITLDEIAIVPVWDDAGAAFPASVFRKLSQAVTIAPHSSSLVAVPVLRSDLANAAKGNPVSGFIVAFQGTLAAPPPVARPGGAAAVAAVPARAAAIHAPNIPLRPIVRPIVATVARTVRCSRQVRLRLQDRQLPVPSVATPHPGPAIFATLGKAGALAGPLVRSGGLAIDPATSVVSVALTAPAPTPAQAAQVRQSVLAALAAGSPQ